VSEFTVINPASGEVVKVVPEATPEALGSAIDTAEATYRQWRRESSIEERAALLRTVADLHTERRQELAQIIVREMGKTLEGALGEVDFCAEIFAYYAETASDALKDEPIVLRAGDGTAYIRREPVGVLLGIMPWNYPYYQVARFAGPNIVAGNVILLKHAPQCPESAAAIEQIFREAGFPVGAYTNLYAALDDIESIIADPRVRGVSLTGSERAGAAVAEIAGRYLKKVVLELGGSDPFILLSTNDMDATVQAALNARMENSGQACNAAKRFIIVDDLYDEFVTKFIAATTGARAGDPNDPDTVLGPLSAAAATKRLNEQVDRAQAEGATLHRTNWPSGNLYPGAVLSGVTADNSIYKEELFGPVAMVFRVSSEDEAVQVANDTDFGLGSYVFTTDREQAVRVAEQIEAGMVFVNIVGADGAELPFGGVKRSGNGRELGRYGFEEFLNKKLVRIG
jgi:succinate-semialdehyde dehydrogenase/glutarate-semialdehyde dehydrogenase